MSPPTWAETSRIAAVVIVTCAHCCLTAVDDWYSMLGTIEFVDESVNEIILKFLNFFGGTCIKSSISSYTPHIVQSVWLQLFKYRGGNNAHWTSKNKMATAAFSESYAARISMKIFRICEFRVSMWIMTSLLGCYSCSTLGSRANDYAGVLTASFALLPRMIDEQYPCSPVIIP